MIYMSNVFDTRRDDGEYIHEIARTIHDLGILVERMDRIGPAPPASQRPLSLNSIVSL